MERFSKSKEYQLAEFFSKEAVMEIINKIAAKKPAGIHVAIH